MEIYHQALDYLLNKLRTDQTNNTFMYFDISAWKLKTSAEIAEKYSLQHWEMPLIYKQLLEDGYVNENPFRLTLKGLTFINSGGYISQENNALRLKTELDAMKTLEKRLKEKVVVQNRWLISIGLVAAIYYTLEIFKFFFPNYFH